LITSIEDEHEQIDDVMRS